MSLAFPLSAILEHYLPYPMVAWMFRGGIMEGAGIGLFGPAANSLLARLGKTGTTK